MSHFPVTHRRRDFHNKKIFACCGCCLGVFFFEQFQILTRISFKNAAICLKAVKITLQVTVKNAVSVLPMEGSLITHCRAVTLSAPQAHLSVVHVLRLLSCTYLEAVKLCLS